MEILVEFLAKLQRKKQKSEEDKAWDEAQKLVNENYQPEDEIEIDFRRVILDLNSFNDIIELEDDLLQVVVDHSRIYLLKMSWDAFKSLFTQLTHKAIFEIDVLKNN